MADQFLHCPDVVSQSGFHGRSNAQRLMDAAETKPRHEDMNGEFQIVQLAAVSVCPADESPKVTTQTEVGALDMASRYITRLRVSASYTWDRSRNPACGTKPIRPGNVVTGVEFNQLSEVDFTSKRALNRVHIGAKSVGCELKAPIHALTEVTHECVRTIRITPPDVVRKNHLRGAVDCNPSVGIAPLSGSIGPQSALMASNRSVDFVSLDKIGAHSAHVGIEHLAASLPRGLKQRKHRLEVYVHESGDSTQTRALHHQRQHTRHLFGGDIVCSNAGVRFAERDFTRGTAVSLNFSLSIRAKSLRVTMVTSDAHHWAFSLTCGAEKAHNFTWVLGCGSYPRRGLTPHPVRAECGVLNVGGLSQARTDSNRGNSPAFYQLNYQPRNGEGIQRFAPENALCSFTHRWWWSD